MLNKSSKLLSIISISMFLILSGCAGKQSSEEKMYDILEKVVSLEKPFVEQQDSFVQLEKQEKDLYDEMMDIGMKEHDQIIVLSDEAIALNDQRKSHVQIERDSIVASEKQFKTIKPIIDKIDTVEVKEEAEKLYDIMMARYVAHEALHENYVTGLELDRELYEMLKQPDVVLNELEEKIIKINDAYEQVLENNETFNDETEKFNEVKQSFYKNAGFEVQAQK